MCNEIWKPVANAKGYEVSSLGRVRSLKWNKPQILKLAPGNGYSRAALFVNNKPKYFSVHRLVAEAFIPNPENKPQVNHINGIKTDNRVENLEWCTASENMRHADATGLRVIPQGEDSPHATLNNEQARYVRDNPDKLTGRTLASIFGVTESTISLIQRGKTFKNAGGRIRESKCSRVTDDARDEIKQLYKRGVRGCGVESLAKKFDLPQSTVRYIVSKISGDV